MIAASNFSFSDIGLHDHQLEYRLPLFNITSKSPNALTPTIMKEEEEIIETADIEPRSRVADLEENGKSGMIEKSSNGDMLAFT